MLGKIEGERRRGRKKLRWLDGITDSLDVNQGKFWEMVKGLGSLACCSPWGWEESVLGDWITTFFHYLEYKHTLFYMDTHLQIKMRIKMKRVELFLLVQISQRLTRVRGGSSVWTHLLGNRAGDVFAWMCVEWQPAENYYNKIIGLIGEKNCRDSNSRSALREENRAETTTNPQQLFFFFGESTQHVAKEARPRGSGARLQVQMQMTAGCPWEDGDTARNSQERRGDCWGRNRFLFSPVLQSTLHLRNSWYVRLFPIFFLFKNSQAKESLSTYNQELWNNISNAKYV